VYEGSPFSHHGGGSWRTGLSANDGLRGRHTRPAAPTLLVHCSCPLLQCTSDPGPLVQSNPTPLQEALLPAPPPAPATGYLGLAQVFGGPSTSWPSHAKQQQWGGGDQGKRRALTTTSSGLPACGSSALRGSRPSLDSREANFSPFRPSLLLVVLLAGAPVEVEGEPDTAEAVVSTGAAWAAAAAAAKLANGLAAPAAGPPNGLAGPPKGGGMLAGKGYKGGRPLGRAAGRAVQRCCPTLREGVPTARYPKIPASPSKITGLPSPGRAAHRARHLLHRHLHHYLLRRLGILHVLLNLHHISFLSNYHIMKGNRPIVRENAPWRALAQESHPSPTKSTTEHPTTGLPPCMAREVADNNRSVARPCSNPDAAAQADPAVGRPSV
jgi:hypothetical protein